MEELAKLEQLRQIKGLTQREAGEGKGTCFRRGSMAKQLVGRRGAWKTKVAMQRAGDTHIAKKDRREIE